MKKFVAISLICFYVLSTTGMAINRFYCCGKLKSISIATSSSAFANCKVPVKKAGCCDKSSQTFKVKDQHVSSASLNALSAPFIAIIPSFFLLRIAVHPTIDEPLIAYGHAPPDKPEIAVYKLNCTYRI